VGFLQGVVIEEVGEASHHSNAGCLVTHLDDPWLYPSQFLFAKTKN
jgi:hypothetical protein